MIEQTKRECKARRSIMDMEPGFIQGRCGARKRQGGTWQAVPSAFVVLVSQEGRVGDDLEGTS